MAYNFKKKATQSETPSEERTDKNLHGKCESWGCTRMGHVHMGKWYCRYHYACHGEKIGEQLNHVSLMLSNHAAEFDWYEWLLQSSFVDYKVGVVDCTFPGQSTMRRPLSAAPDGMQPEPGEEFVEYRNRIEDYINKTLLRLESKTMAPAINDWKSAAAGEKFNNIGDFAPSHLICEV